jgi:hypothetical protein
MGTLSARLPAPTMGIGDDRLRDHVLNAMYRSNERRQLLLILATNVVTDQMHDAPTARRTPPQRHADLISSKAAIQTIEAVEALPVVPKSGGRGEMCPGAWACLHAAWMGDQCAAEHPKSQPAKLISMDGQSHS